MFQFFSDGCPQADPNTPESQWGSVNPFLTPTLGEILPGDLLIHEARSVAFSGHAMVALTGVVKAPGVLNGDPHVVIAECTKTCAKNPAYGEGGVQINRVRARHAGSTGIEIQVGSYWIEANVGRLR